MSIISFHHKGDFKNTEKFLTGNKKLSPKELLTTYGEMGVAALKANTPVDSGKTANSWIYTLKDEGGRAIIEWSNTNVNKGVNIAVILQYGHGTGTGGWVEGRDYINPAIQPIFDKIADEAWQKITNE